MSRADRRTRLVAATGGVLVYVLGLQDVVRAFGWQFALIVLLALAGASLTIAMAIALMHASVQDWLMFQDGVYQTQKREIKHLNAIGGADLETALEQRTTITQQAKELFDERLENKRIRKENRDFRIRLGLPVSKETSDDAQT